MIHPGMIYLRIQYFSKKKKNQTDTYAEMRGKFWSWK